jgi:carboxyl-terminal processing protease
VKRQPFAGEPRAVVVLPAEDPTLGGEAALLEHERAGFEAELGTTVEISVTDPGEGPRWLLRLDGEPGAPATIEFDPDQLLIVSRASDVGGLFESVNLWRTRVRTGGATLAATDCADLEAVIERVEAEVADTYPSFELRGLDWATICERHADRVRAADDPLAALQRWLAELQDGHTWAWAPIGNLPYAVRVSDGAATFSRVPEATAAHDAGVRPGWRLHEIDGARVDADGWLARAAAPPHSRALIAGRRLLAGPSGTPRALTAVSPGGEGASWEEAPTPLPELPLVTWRRLDAEHGYVQVRAWAAGRGIDEAVDEALADLAGCATLILDLRGNPGGNLLLATRTRDRFLRERTTLGSIRYSTGEGRLSEPVPVVAEPAPVEKRWSGRLVTLTDPLTFSSSEDFQLGLQGLEHVTVAGAPSGGGSGRPRSLRLLRGWTLTVSTALTYDREGRCVEGAGIPVDVEATGTDDEVLAAARAL